MFQDRLKMANDDDEESSMYHWIFPKINNRGLMWMREAKKQKKNVKNDGNIFKDGMKMDDDDDICHVSLDLLENKQSFISKHIF